MRRKVLAPARLAVLSAVALLAATVGDAGAQKRQWTAETLTPDSTYSTPKSVSGSRALDVSTCDSSSVEDGQRARGSSDHDARSVRYNAFGEGDPGTSLDHRAGRSE